MILSPKKKYERRTDSYPHVLIGYKEHKYLGPLFIVTTQWGGKKSHTKNLTAGRVYVYDFAGIREERQFFYTWAATIL